MFLVNGAGPKRHKGSPFTACAQHFHHELEARKRLPWLSHRRLHSCLHKPERGSGEVGKRPAPNGGKMPRRYNAKASLALTSSRHRSWLHWTSAHRSAAKSAGHPEVKGTHAEPQPAVLKLRLDHCHPLCAALLKGHLSGELLARWGIGPF